MARLCRATRSSPMRTPLSCGDSAVDRHRRGRGHALHAGPPEVRELRRRRTSAARQDRASGDRAPALIAAVGAAYPDYSPTHVVSGGATPSASGAIPLGLPSARPRNARPSGCTGSIWETPAAKGRLRHPTRSRSRWSSTMSNGPQLRRPGRRAPGGWPTRCRRPGSPSPAWGAPRTREALLPHGPPMRPVAPCDDGVRPREPRRGGSAGRGSARPVVGITPLIRPAELGRSGRRKVIFSLF